MGTEKLSEGIKRHIKGWELIAEKCGDFNLGDEVVKNLFYDRDNSRVNIIFSLNYCEFTVDEDPDQEVLLFECYDVWELRCGFMQNNDAIQSIRYKDFGDIIDVIVDSAGMSFTCSKISVSKMSWADAMTKLTNRKADILDGRKTL